MRRTAVPLACLATLLLLATLFRLPPLYNANAINSDAAVAGLQAMHILKGEWAFRLWGTSYQGIVDTALIALAMKIFGPKPIAVLSVPFVGVLVMIALVFDVLRRRMHPVAAAACTMTLVFQSMASNTPMVVIMRQVLATTLVLGIWLADGAANPSAEGGGAPRSGVESSPLRRQRLALSAACFALGIYIDSFAIVSYPAVGFFWIACTFDLQRIPSTTIDRAIRIGKRALAFVVGVFAIVLVASSEARKHFGESSSLVFGQCLPFALSTRIYQRGAGLNVEPWTPPAPFVLVQLVGAALFLVAIGYAVHASRRPSIPWPIRRLGLTGVIAALSCTSAMVISGRGYDVWAARYLAPMFWFSSFSLAPLAYSISRRRFVAMLAPYWASTLVAGWLSYMDYVDGPRIRIDRTSTLVDENALRAELVAAGVHHAVAQYWIAYRLTFLWAEDPLVATIDKGEDRYPPYRAAVEAAPIYAMIFHPVEPRALPEPAAKDLEARGIPFERREVAGFTVFIVRRSTPPVTSGNSGRE